MKVLETVLEDEPQKNLELKRSHIKLLTANPALTISSLGTYIRIRMRLPAIYLPCGFVSQRDYTHL